VQTSYKVSKIEFFELSGQIVRKWSIKILKNITQIWN